MMISPSRPRSTFAALLTVLTVGGVTACASTTANLSALDMAMTRDVAELETDAAVGEARAQLALAIVAAHGLDGRQPDLDRTRLWLQRVARNQRDMPVTQYIAPLDGRGSTVNVIRVPVRAMPAAEMTAVLQCVSALATHAPDDSACGGSQAERAARRAAWRKATQ
jgi:hypothetical protein